MKIIEFWGLKCPPCEKIGAYIEELSKENQNLNIEKIAVHEQPDLVFKYKVMTVPTIVILKNDEIIYKGYVGGLSKIQLNELISKYE
jgi:thioredoxin 1